MSAASRANVILRGGPENFPEDQRLRFVEDLQSVLKVPYMNRREHFRRSTETVRADSAVLTVFEWSGSTYVAE